MNPIRNSAIEPPGTERLERLFRIDEIAQMGGPKRAKLYEHIQSRLASDGQNREHATRDRERLSQISRTACGAAVKK